MKTGWIKYALTALGAALIAAGLMGGQQLMVLRKAVHICLECIGVG